MSKHSRALPLLVSSLIFSFDVIRGQSNRTQHSTLSGLRTPYTFNSCWENDIGKSLGYPSTSLEAALAVSSDLPSGCRFLPRRPQAHNVCAITINLHLSKVPMADLNHRNILRVQLRHRSTTTANLVGPCPSPDLRCQARRPRQFCRHHIALRRISFTLQHKQSWNLRNSRATCTVNDKPRPAVFFLAITTTSPTFRAPR